MNTIIEYAIHIDKKPTKYNHFIENGHTLVSVETENDKYILINEVETELNKIYVAKEKILVTELIFKNGDEEKYPTLVFKLDNDEIKPFGFEYDILTNKCIEKILKIAELLDENNDNSNKLSDFAREYINSKNKTD